MEITPATPPKNMIPSQVASLLFGYSQDYIGQLARGGKVTAVKIKGSWYVDKESLASHLATADEVKKKFGGRPTTGRVPASEIGIKSILQIAPIGKPVALRRNVNVVGKGIRIPSLYASRIPTASQKMASVANVVPPFIHAVDMMQRALFIAFFIAIVAGSAHASFTGITPPSQKSFADTFAVFTSDSFPSLVVNLASTLPCESIRTLAHAIADTETQPYAHAITASAAAARPVALVSEKLCSR